MVDPWAPKSTTTAFQDDRPRMDGLPVSSSVESPNIVVMH
jgi:hypothetical protein